MLANSRSAPPSPQGLGTPSPPKPWEGGGGVAPSATASTPPSAPASAPPVLPDTTLPYSSAYAGPYQQQYGGMINPGSGMYGNSPYSYGSNTGVYGGGLGGGYGTGYGVGYGSGWGSTGGGYGTPYGSMAGGYGMQPPQWERSTAETFSSLQGIVSSFMGFAQMLESTFFATQAGFMAMMSVYDAMARLRATLAASGKGVVQWTRDVISSRHPSKNSSTNVSGKLTKPARSSTSPIWLFMLIFGVPWVLSLISRRRRRPPPIPEFYKALYDFTPSDMGQGSAGPSLPGTLAKLGFRKGQVLAVLSKSSNVSSFTHHPVTDEQQDSLLSPAWWIGRSKEGQMGLVPSNYLERIPLPPSALSLEVSNVAS